MQDLVRADSTGFARRLARSRSRCGPIGGKSSNAITSVANALQPTAPVSGTGLERRRRR
jgi:hypothetical protein